MRACLETCLSAAKRGLDGFEHDVGPSVHHVSASDHDDDALVMASALLQVEVDHLVVEHKVHHVVAPVCEVVEHEVLSSPHSAQALRRRVSKKLLSGSSSGDGQHSHSISLALAVGLVQGSALLSSDPPFSHAAYHRAG